MQSRIRGPRDWDWTPVLDDGIDDNKDPRDLYVVRLLCSETNPSMLSQVRKKYVSTREGHRKKGKILAAKT